MKRALLSLCLVALSLPAVAGMVYEWTDNEGVVHFTDNPRTIPPKYRKGVKERGSENLSPPAPRPAPAPRSAPPPEVARPGGHPAQWWRQSFQGLRGRIRGLEEGLPAKRDKLLELRRRRTVFHRPVDREAFNRQQAEITADESQIALLKDKLDALELDADREGVPKEWRR